MVGISKSVGRGATAKQGNQSSDIRVVQCLLNLERNRSDSSNTEPRLMLSGKLDDATQKAIDLYQRKALKIAEPDGRVDKGGGMIRRLAAALPALPNTAYIEPAWLKAAYGEEQAKVREAGPAHDFTTNTERILEHLETAKNLSKSNYVYTAKKDGKKVKVDSGYKHSQVEDTPWCACFVNWCRPRSRRLPRQHQPSSPPRLQARQQPRIKAQRRPSPQSLHRAWCSFQAARSRWARRRMFQADPRP